MAVLKEKEMLRENVLEMMEKEYPDGFVLLTMDGVNASTTISNPDKSIFLEDANSRLQNCLNFYHQMTHLMGPDDGEEEGESHVPA